MIAEQRINCCFLLSCSRRSFHEFTNLLLHTKYVTEERQNSLLGIKPDHGLRTPGEEICKWKIFFQIL